MTPNLQYSVYHDDFSFYGYLLNEFQKTIPVDFIISGLEYRYDDIPMNVETFIAEEIRSKLGLSIRIQHIENRWFYIHGFEGADQVLMMLCRHQDMGFHENIFEKTKDVLNLKICGRHSIVESVVKLFAQPPHGKSWMKWYFLSDGRMDSRTIEIDQKHTVYNEMYPWIEGGIDNFFKRYLESDANVLILLGDPGTGKTTFIRELIVKNKLDAMITYEEDLMASDRLYMDLVTGDNHMLILEDADLILASREMAGNKLMSKLLNISDGLMKNKKKIVFTANISYNSLNKTDHALIRPGRCFGVMNFRPLTYPEALAAANIMGLKEPAKADQISLAKLTNPDYEDPNIQKMGFGF